MTMTTLNTNDNSHSDNSHSDSTPITVRSPSRAAIAVQWDGTAATLRRLQDLLYPFSPWLNATSIGSSGVPALGVPVSKASILAGDQRTMEHVEKDGWVILRDDGWVGVLSDATFRREYTIAEPDASS